jgi:aspartyl-tRNA(Asn)/glutamyl-tRNA(Gln) amidotransferase subunit A
VSRESSIIEVAEAIRSGRLTAESVLAAGEARYRASEAGPEPVNAFISTCFDPPGDEALHDTQVSGPLASIPVAVKDNIATLDLDTTCGSRILCGYRSPYEATAVARLRAAGARVIGKTNMDEFAMGSSTEHSTFGPTRNPLNRARVPGGSSGGSAASVAAGIVRIALGSETGGSVRQPAAFCGVVGIKPTYGRVSRRGLIAFASSLDQVGVFGRTVAEAATTLEIVSGHDPLDATSIDVRAPRAGAAVPRSLEGVVVGVAEEYLNAEVEPGVRRSCRDALLRLEELGAELREVSLPHTSLALASYYVIAPAEASSNLARFDGLRFGPAGNGPHADPDALYESTRTLFGAEVRRRILLGTLLLSAGSREQQYARAQHARSLIEQDFHFVFGSGVHAIFTPTTPGVAFPLGSRLNDPMAMYGSDAFTVAANLARIPAVSIPVGDVDGLPVGAQLMGAMWDEERLIGIAAALEAHLVSGAS